MQFIWLLVYYLDDLMLEYFENSISKLEMDCIKNIKSKLTKIDDIEPLIEASKEIEQFLKESKNFENIINGKKLKIFDSLNKEKYLEKIKKEKKLFDSKIEFFGKFNLEHYSKKLQKEQINIEEQMNISQNDIMESNNIKLDDLIFKLIKQIENKKEDEIEKIWCKILINYLENIKNQKIPDEYCNICHNQFISFQKKINQENNLQHNYLDIFTFEKNEFLKTELIIKYSIIKEFIDKLQLNENNDILYFLMKLFQIDGMNQIS